MIDDQISILNDQIILNKNKLEVEKSEGIVKSVYSTIPETVLLLLLGLVWGIKFYCFYYRYNVSFCKFNLRDPELIEKEKIIKKELVYFGGLYVFYHRGQKI